MQNELSSLAGWLARLLVPVCRVFAPIWWDSFLSSAVMAHTDAHLRKQQRPREQAFGLQGVEGGERTGYSSNAVSNAGPDVTSHLEPPAVCSAKVNLASVVGSLLGAKKLKNKNTVIAYSRCQLASRGRLLAQVRFEHLPEAEGIARKNCPNAAQERHTLTVINNGSRQRTDYLFLFSASE